MDKAAAPPYDIWINSEAPQGAVIPEGKGKRTMAVPKRRTSHARQGKRRSHLHVKPVQIQYCPQCNEPVLPHRVCPNCGHYQGREVVPPDEEK